MLNVDTKVLKTLHNNCSFKNVGSTTLSQNNGSKTVGQQCCIKTPVLTWLKLCKETWDFSKYWCLKDSTTKTLTKNVLNAIFGHLWG